MLCIFVALVFVMGGGSRADILSLALLRPLALFVAAYALLVAQPGDLRRAAWPLGLLGCLTAILVLQLVPLPPKVWSALPGRELYVQIANDAGIPLVDRPLTLSPSRTLNALFSLSIPFAAVLIAAVQSERNRAKTLTVLLFASGASAIVAIAQMAGPDGGPLYLYRVTNPGFPVGLFANRNHQALLMVVLLILIADYYRRRSARGTTAAIPLLGIGMAALVVFALILISGSRAGLLLGALALPTIGWMFFRGRGERAGKPDSKLSRRWLALGAASLLALVATAIAFSRAASIDRLRSEDALSDYRFERLALLADMLRDHWLFGVGFGAFQGAFKRYETIEVLIPFIFNQAHNDWIQFVIEGGLPAALLLLVVVAWLAIRAVRVVRFSREGSDGGFAALAILVFIALASIVDYPFRTPIFMLVGALAFVDLERRTALRGPTRP